MLPFNSVCLKVMSPSFLHDIACCSYMVLSSHNYQEVFSMGVHISNAYHPTNPTLTKLNYDHLIGNTFNQMDEPCCSAISFNLISMQSIVLSNELRVVCAVCSCHVTYTFQSESTLYSCLNVKELLARSRREI